MDFVYSIIIPHKNSPLLLERLLMSIPKRNDIQIVVVDDNSEDGQYQALVSLVNKNNIELYKNEGTFAGGARNTGLKYATGKWLIFADSDDYFTENAFTRILKLVDSKADIVYFDVISRYANSMQAAHRDEHIKKIIKQFLKSGCSDFLRFKHTVPWGKMIKRSLVKDNDIHFEEIIAGNDMMFAILCGFYANKIEYVNEAIYCVTVSSGSITTSLSKDRFDSRFRATVRVNNFLKRIGKGSHQISVLYFLVKAKQFGLRYLFEVIFACIRNKANVFIGFSKVFSYKKVLEDRQNPTFTIQV